MIYGKLGSSEQTFSNKPIDGLILMNSERPEADYVATTEGEWIAKPFDIDALLKGAYECQNKYMDTNFLLLYSNGVAKGTDAPHFNVYKQFMYDLWTAYETRKTTSESNYEFDMMPSEECSYSELQEEIMA